MVKIQELFPSCTGKTKETWTTANQVQSRYQEVCHLSAHVSIGHCWGSWQCVEVPQSLYFANFERAEISILLPFDSLRFEGKIFFTIVMGNEMLSGLGWIWDDLGVCVAPQRESCYELVAPAHVRICIVTSSPAIPCSGKKVLRKVVDWKIEC